MSYPAPNFTQIPNLLLEDHIKAMTEAEMRVALAIARKTFGWHKRQDKLSLSQLMSLTGMSRQGVINGIEAGIARGIIRREQDGQSFLYELVILDKPVNEVDQSKNPSTSQPSRPELVNEVDQLNTKTSQRSRPTKERNKRNKLNKSDQGVDRAEPTPSPAPAEPPKRELLVPNDGYDLKPRNGASPSPNSGGPLPHMERTVSVKPKRGRSNADRLSPHVKGAKFTEADLVEPGTGANAVAVFYEFYSIYKYRLSAPVEDRLVKRDLNLAQWRSAVEAWQDADHRPTYIKGILDWYNDPSKIASSNKPARKEQSSNGNQPTAPAPAEPSPYAKLKAGR